MDADEASSWASGGAAAAGAAQEDPYARLQGGLADQEPVTLLLTCLAALLAGSTSAAAGIGGGGLFMPLYSVVLGLGSRCAVPVSKVTILGVAIGNNFGLLGLGKHLGLRRSAGVFFERHPKAQEVQGGDGPGRPLIDFDIASYMQISILLGTIFGVVLNHVLPEIVLLVALGAVLGFTGLTSLRKGLAQRARHNKLAYAAMDAGGADCADADGSSADDEDSVEVEGADGVEHDEDEGEDETFALQRTESVFNSLSELYASEAKTAPTFPIGLLLVLTAYLFLYAGVRRHSFGDEMRCDSARYIASWCWMLSPLLVFAAAFAVAARRLAGKHRDRKAWAYRYIDIPEWGRDVKWDTANLCKLPAVGLVAGTFSGMLGIGGGMITGPLLLKLGTNPQVSSASTGFMLVFTASSTSIQYILGGELPLQWAALFGATGYAAGVVGSGLVRTYLQRMGLHWSVLLLSAIILASCCSMVALGRFHPPDHQPLPLSNQRCNVQASPNCKATSSSTVRAQAVQTAARTDA